MKKLLQAVDIKKWAKKITASTVIASLLIIDAAKAMEDDDAEEKAVKSLSYSQFEEQKSLSSDGFLTYLSMESNRDVRDKKIPLLVRNTSIPNLSNPSIQSHPDSREKGTETTPLLSSRYEIALDIEEYYGDSQPGCCSGRPLWPTPSTYTLEEEALKKASRFLDLFLKGDSESHGRESQREQSTGSESSPGLPAVNGRNQFEAIPGSPIILLESDDDASICSSVFSPGTSPKSARLTIAPSDLGKYMKNEFEIIPSDSSAPPSLSMPPQTTQNEKGQISKDEELLSSLLPPENNSEDESEEGNKDLISSSSYNKHSLPPPLTSSSQSQEIQKLTGISPTLTPGNSSGVDISEEEINDFTINEPSLVSSSSPHGSPPKDLGMGGVLLPSDEDDPEVTFDNSAHSAAYPAATDYQSLSNLRSPFGIPIDASLSPTHHSLLPAHDVESGEFVPPSMSAQAAFKQLLNDLKKLPASAKSQLKDFVHQVLNGKSTWPGRLGKWVIGPIIGGVFAYMMAPVYDGGIGYLYTQGAKLNNFIESNFLHVFLWYIILSAVPDGISRNAHLWKKGIAYLAQEGKEIGRMCTAGGISFLTAIIPPVYLITAEEFPIKLQGLHGFDNVFAITMLVGCPFLYLDAFANDFYIAWTAFPEIKEWVGKLWRRPSLRSQLPVLQDGPHERFDTILKNLEYFLFQAPKSVIKEIYDNVTQVKEGAQVSCCENYDEALASQQAFAVLSYFLSLGDEVVEKASKPKSIYDVFVDVCNYLCLITGTPARGTALQFIGATVFGLVFSDPIAQILGGIYMIFALLPQTGLEYQGMDNFFKRFIFEEDPHGHGAHPIYRGLTKLYCAFQGLIYTFPLAVLTLQAFQQWFGEGWWPLLVAIPFLIPEFAAQTYSFNGTYNQLVATSITNVHNTKTRKCFGKESTSNWKRDWLIRFVQESRAELKHWHPDMIANLSKGIAVFQKAE